MWSPVNSESRIVALADTARASIIASSENLGDTEIQDALVRAESRGVKVRLLAPLCDLNSNPFFDVPFVRKLDAAGVDARMMPGPSSARRPYIHAKMMIVDGRVAYLGSVNFSENSTRHARELGIVFSDHAAIVAMTLAFESDWEWARPPPANLEGACSEP
jgi:phosphatidylserine/phosphatidylglycerophosphate/cardiolipin synthase-like enzyme